jgi:hypothetical protein
LCLYRWWEDVPFVVGVRRWPHLVVIIGIGCDSFGWWSSLVGDLVESDGLVAAWAEAAEADAAHEGPAVLAALHAELAGPAAVALIHGGGPAGLARGEHGQRRGGLVAAPPAGLAAGI